MRDNPFPNPEGQAITRFLSIYKNLPDAQVRAHRAPDSKELEGLSVAICENLADVSDAAFADMRENVDYNRVSEIWHGDYCSECDPKNEGRDCKRKCRFWDGADYDESVDAKESFDGELENLARRMGCKPDNLLSGIWFDYISELLGEYSGSSDTYWDSNWYGSLGLIDLLWYWHGELTRTTRPKNEAAEFQFGDTLARFPSDFTYFLDLQCAKLGASDAVIGWVSDWRDVLTGLAQGLHESIDPVARDLLYTKELQPIRDWLAGQCETIGS